MSNKKRWKNIFPIYEIYLFFTPAMAAAAAAPVREKKQFTSSI
jgi:hypothetical protein